MPELGARQPLERNADDFAGQADQLDPAVGARAPRRGTGTGSMGPGIGIKWVSALMASRRLQLCQPFCQPALAARAAAASIAVGAPLDRTGIVDRARRRRDLDPHPPAAPHRGDDRLPAPARGSTPNLRGRTTGTAGGRWSGPRSTLAARIAAVARGIRPSGGHRARKRSRRWPGLALGRDPRRAADRLAHRAAVDRRPAPARDHNVVFGHRRALATRQRGDEN